MKFNPYRAVKGLIAAQWLFTICAANGRETSSMRLAAPDAFDAAPVLAMREDMDLRPGHFQRIKLIKAHFKHPYIRIEESVEDTPSGRNIIREKIMVADHVIVRLRPGTDAKQFAQRNGMNIRRKLILPNVYLMGIPVTLSGVPDTIKKLKRQSEVIFVSADTISQANGVPPNSPFFSKQWALHNGSDKDIDAPEAWDWTTGSNAVKVAVLDSGVLLNHPDLSLNIGVNASEIANNGVDDDGNGFVDDKWGWDFVNNDADPMDDFGHGTKVAGIIGAQGNNGEGVEGVCWKVKLVPIKVANENGDSLVSDISEGILYAASLGVNIINLSLGDYEYAPAEELALEEASKKDIVIVCSAGNDGNSNDIHALYPACYSIPNILSVAATDSEDHLVDIAGGWASNYGVVSVDLAAPGSSCYTTTLPSLQFPYQPYGHFHGTSCAASHVTGVCALVKSLKPSLSAAQIKAIVLQSADKIPSLTGKVTTGGRLNAYRAVKMAMGNPLASLHAEPDFYAVPFNKVLKVENGAAVSDDISVTTGPTILSNDTLPIGTPVSVSLKSNPSQGGNVSFFVKNNVPAFIYHPKLNFAGTDTFEYVVTAGNETAIGKVTITVQLPFAEEDEYKSGNNTISVNEGMGVLQNDKFGMPPNAGICLQITQLPQYGTLTPTMKNNVWTGGFLYTRTSNFGVNAIDTFKYKVQFGSAAGGKVLETNEATVTLITGYVPKFNLVWEEWSLPTAIEQPASYILPSYNHAPLEIGVMFPQEAKGSVKITRQPLQGSITLSANGELQYLPKQGAGGGDKFQIMVGSSGGFRTIEVIIQPSMSN